MSSFHILHLAVGYQKEPLLVADGLQLKPGEVTALVGKNGSGKSTFLRTLAGIHNPISAQCTWNNESFFDLPPEKKAQMVSTVFTQRIGALGLDVTTTVRLGRFPNAGSLGWTSRMDDAIADQYMNLIGIAHLAHRQLSELSDGEFQKVMICRALTQQTPLLLLDEPTAFLDFEAKKEFMLLIHRLAKEQNVSVLMSTHDLHAIHRTVSCIWWIENKRIKNILPTDERFIRHLV